MNPTAEYERIPWGDQGRPVVFDYETSGLHADDGMTPAILALRWGPGENEYAILPFDQGALDKRGVPPTLFGDASNLSVDQWNRVHVWMLKQRLISHNAKFDLWVAWRGLRSHDTYPNDTSWDLSHSLYWDSMVIHSLLEPGQRVAIDKICHRHGWYPDYQEVDYRMHRWVKGNKIKGDVRYDTAPWDVIYPYALGDVTRTWTVWEWQKNRIDEGVVPRGLFNREMACIRMLFNMERKGLGFDIAESREIAASMQQNMANIQTLLPFPPQSELKAKQWFYTRHGFPPRRTEKGALKLDAATLGDMAKADIPYAAEFAWWKDLRQAVALWYDGWADKTGRDGRVRTTYQQVKWQDDRGRNRGTRTGRFAVERVNLQAIPHDRQIPDGYKPLRRLIRPSDGFRLWEADLSQADMRVAACLAECGPMLDGFADGLDAHDTATTAIWGLKKGDAQFKARRNVAKRLSFGILYGAGVATLAEQIRIFTGEDLGEDGVRDLWSEYRRQFPELFNYGKKLQKEVEKNGFIVLPGGKVRSFLDGEPSFKALNAMVQGGVASCMVESMIRIDREFPNALVGQVHDSVMFEFHKSENNPPIAKILTETFESWYKLCEFPTNLEEWK
jgi:DNA polymerase I-like protein with 3'-5' exonuclease and polymerase domains